MDLLGRGLITFPVSYKVPLVSDWQDLEKAVDLSKDATGYGVQCGRRSGITVIDWDDKYESLVKYCEKNQIPMDTFIVKSPGGGAHMYYKYDERLKTTTKLGGLEIDVRNDGAQIIGPNSLYKGSDKRYTAITKWDLKPLHPHWLSIQPKHKSTEVKAEQNVNLYLKMMHEYGLVHNSCDDWRNAVWDICRMSNQNGWDATQVADQYSRALPNYKGREDVEKLVARFKPDRHKLDTEYFLKQVPDHIRQEFKGFRSMYYFTSGLHELMAKSREDGLLDKRMVMDFMCSAVVKVIRSGTPTYYLREPTAWTRYTKTGIPFNGEHVAKFKYQGQDAVVKTSMQQMFVDECQWSRRFRKYNKTTFIHHYDNPPLLPHDTFNLFCGYKQSALNPEAYEKLLKVCGDDFEFMMNHWLETMCGGNKQFFEYTMNWLSWLLRRGEDKLRTFLVFVGSQGIGKDLIFNTLLGKGIIGKHQYNIVNDLKRFQGHFNSIRENKVLHIFNECTNVMKSKVCWDKIKSLIDADVIIEPKGQEPYKSEDNAGCIFLSNNGAVTGCPVKIDNDDRRYACVLMSEKRKGDTEYFGRLAKAVKDDRIRQLFFTFLVNRDISSWKMADIPQTDLKRKFKQGQTDNNILSYLCEIIVNKQSPWYRYDLKEKDCWFSREVVSKKYFEWCDKSKRHSRSWKDVHAMLMKAQINYSRRVDRSIRPLFENTKAPQVVCYQLTKDSILRAHRLLLNDPDWVFPELA